MTSKSKPRSRRTGRRPSHVEAETAPGGSWGSFLCATWQVGFEASLVVPLRLVRLASGGEAAAQEARLMVDEKVEAHGHVISAIGKGRYGSKAGQIANGAMRHYLDCVRANRRRLMRGR